MDFQQLVNTVLITGADVIFVIASRAKQSHPCLTEALVKEGAKVKAFSYYNSFNNWGCLEDREKYLCGKIVAF